MDMDKAMCGRDFASRRRGRSCAVSSLLGANRKASVVDLDQSTKAVDKSGYNPYREARNMRRILHFCDLPRNEAAIVLENFDFAPEWLTGLPN
jgi:hypothetical protein